MRQRERVIFNQGSASNRKVSAGLAGNRKSTVHRSVSRMEKLLNLQRTHGNAFVQRLVQRKLATGTETACGQELWPFARRHDANAESKSNLESLFQRNPIGTEDEAMGTYVAQPGDSLSLIPGYPNGGWQERLDQLIAANHDHPNIKNR